jgi:hypothetical protein
LTLAQKVVDVLARVGESCDPALGVGSE